MIDYTLSEGVLGSLRQGDVRLLVVCMFTYGYNQTESDIVFL
jgi:hypothetical protein